MKKSLIVIFSILINIPILVPRLLYAGACRRSDSVEPLWVYANDEQPKVFEALRRKYPRFFELGGGFGQIYQIIDPANKVDSFVLSGITQNGMKYSVAENFCAERGGSLLTRVQLEALIRAITRNGAYDPNLIFGMWGTYFWLAHEPGTANFLFGGKEGFAINSHGYIDTVAVRCVLNF